MLSHAAISFVRRLGRSPREGKGYPLQYSGLEDRPRLVWRNGTLLASQVVHEVTGHLSSCMWNLWVFLDLDQGSNLGPLHWELGVLATALPGKSVNNCFKCPWTFCDGEEAVLPHARRTASFPPWGLLAALMSVSGWRQGKESQTQSSTG